MQRLCDARFARYWRICLARRAWRVRVSPEESRLADSQPALSTPSQPGAEHAGGSEIGVKPLQSAGRSRTGTESHQAETCGTIRCGQLVPSGSRIAGFRALAACVLT